MTRDEIAAGLDEAATYPGGRGTGAGIPAHTPWCASGQGYPCNCDDALYDDPSPTPQERLAAARAAGEPSVPKWAKAMFDAQAGMIAEQAERIDAQADIIDQLHTANKHLAGRFDKVEREFAEWKDRQHGINQDVYRTIDRECGKLDQARINGDNAADQRIQARAIELGRRIDGLGVALETQARDIASVVTFQHRAIEADPRLGEPTVAEQCSVSWTQPKEED